MMNTYKSTRYAKFLLNYHFIWIPKYRKHILDNPEIKQLTWDTINELADTHNFEVLTTYWNDARPYTIKPPNRVG